MHTRQARPVSRRFLVALAGSAGLCSTFPALAATARFPVAITGAEPASAATRARWQEALTRVERVAGAGRTHVLLVDTAAHEPMLVSRRRGELAWHVPVGMFGPPLGLDEQVAVLALAWVNSQGGTDPARRWVAACAACGIDPRATMRLVDQFKNLPWVAASRASLTDSLASLGYRA